MRVNSINHLKNCLANNTPKVYETHIMELNEDFLIDLHHGQVLNGNDYIEKMSTSATNGGVWGDFTTIKWLSVYLSRPSNVWNVHSGRILSTFGIEFNIQIIHLAFDSKKWHFEPMEAISGLIPTNVPIETTQSKIIDLIKENLSNNNGDECIKSLNKFFINSNYKKKILI